MLRDTSSTTTTALSDSRWGWALLCISGPARARIARVQTSPRIAKRSAWVPPACCCSSQGRSAAGSSGSQPDSRQPRRYSSTSTTAAGSSASSHKGRANDRLESSSMGAAPADHIGRQRQAQQQRQSQGPGVQGGGLAIRQAVTQCRLKLVQLGIDRLQISLAARAEVAAAGEQGDFLETAFIQFDGRIELQLPKTGGYPVLGLGIGTDADGEDANAVFRRQARRP